MKKLLLWQDQFKLLDLILFALVLSSFPALVAIYLKSFNPLTWNRIHAKTYYVDSYEQEWGILRKDLDVSSKAMKIGEQHFPQGLGTHARSRIKIVSKGDFRRFSGNCGISSLTNGQGNGVFKVRVRGEEVFNSGIMRAGQPAKSFSVPLNGERVVELEVDPAGLSIDFSHANWANLSFE